MEKEPIKEIEILSWSWSAVSTDNAPPEFNGKIEFADGSTYEFDSLPAPGLAMALHAATEGGPFDEAGKDVFVHISAVERTGNPLYNVEAYDAAGNLVGTTENGEYIDVITMLGGL